MTNLVQIKILHPVIWFFFAGCIVAIPIVGARGHFVWAAVLIGWSWSSAVSWRRIVVGVR